MAFAIAIALNLTFVVAEVIAGLASQSMALLADAGHNLSDVLSLLLAWGASVLAARPRAIVTQRPWKNSFGWCRELMMRWSCPISSSREYWEMAQNLSFT